MEIKEHSFNELRVAEVISEQVIIKNTNDALDLLGNLYYQGFDKIIIHQKNLIPGFFDLKNKMAGDILQKFSQYRMSLSTIGDYSKYRSESLKAFMFESNKGTQVNFLNSISDALKRSR